MWSHHIVGESIDSYTRGRSILDFLPSFNLRLACAKRRTATLAVAIMLVALAGALSGNLAASAVQAATPNLHMPFEPGTAWIITEGYNTSPEASGAHWNCDEPSDRDQDIGAEPCRAGWQYRFALDFEAANGESEGRIVLAPVDGIVRWVDSANGAVAIDSGDGNAIAISHLSLIAGLQSGQPLVAGQQIGTVAPPGEAGNNGLPRIQIAAWETSDGGNWDRRSVPFSGPLALDGYDLPDLGTTISDQHGSTIVYSSNVSLVDIGRGTPTRSDATTLTAKGSGDSTVSFSWAAVAGADEYQVVVDDVIFGPWSSVPGTTMTLGSGDHTWQVRARNSVGTSPFSDAVEVPFSSDLGLQPPLLTVSDPAGNVDDIITVGGFSFKPDESVTIEGARGVLATVGASSSGTFSTEIAVPAATSGDTYIRATGSNGSQAKRTVTIVPSLELESSQASPGTNLEITAQGFASDELVEFRWGQNDGVVFGTIQTDAYGSGTTTVTIPDAPSGPHEFAGTGVASGGFATGTVDIRPVMTLSTNAADPGASVDVTGRGFPAHEQVSVRVNADTASTGDELCVTDTDESGRAACTITVPKQAAGDVRLSMAINDDINSSALLAINGPPSVTTSPDNAVAGENVEIQIGGFEPGERVEISIGETPWQTIDADSNGAAVAEGTVPNEAAGNTEVTAAAGDDSTVASSFTVASAPELSQASLTGTGRYKVVATREGLVGGTTSNGHVIVENDHFVSLPACTATSCPWYEPGRVDERWGVRTECGDKCYVKVINETTGSCEVAPIWDTGPWFTVDDWWQQGPDRYLNKLRSNATYLAQGVTGAGAARDGLDVGYGIGPDGIGSSNRYESTGNASAIDLGDGTWRNLGLDFNKGIDVIDVEMLWQTGGDPAAQAARCGHALDQPTSSSGVTLTPSSAEVGEIVVAEGSGFRGGETVTFHLDSPSGVRIGTTQASSSGSIQKSVRIQDSTYGSHTMVAVGASSGTRKNGVVRVQPSIDRNPTSGAVGTPLTLSVHGYGPNELVRASWDNANGDVITYIRTNERGAGSRTFTVPNRAAGWNTYYAVGGSSNAGAYGAFQITSEGSVSYPPGDSTTSFSGDRLTPVWSWGSSNGSGSNRVWDGIFWSSWYSKSPYPTSGGFGIDLGQEYLLSGVRWQLKLPGEADSFAVETSVDGRSWTYVGTYGNAPVSTWYGEDLYRYGRYVRVTFGNPNRDARIGGMTEIEVYGRKIDSSSSNAPAGSNPSFSGSNLRIASSTASTGTTASTRAHDGSTSSSWNTTTTKPNQAALTLDLGDIKSVSGVKWTFSTEGGADALTLMTSTDGSTWKTAGTSSNRKALTWEGLAVSRDARYIRFVFGNSYSSPTLGYLAEVRVFGTALIYPGDVNPQGDTNTTFKGSKLQITRSFGSSNGSGSGRVWDGNDASSWYTVTSKPTYGYFQLYLDDVHTLSGIRWKFNGSGEADSMLIQTSTDGSTWTSVGRYGNAPANTWRGENLSRTGRYVRFIFANPNNDPRIGLVSEVEIWGDPQNAPAPDPNVLAGSNPTFSGEALPIVSAADSASPSGIQTSGGAKAIDGRTSTSWYTSGGTPTDATITFDLGKNRHVSGVKWMYERSDGVDRQALQVSPDGSGWSQLVVTSARQPDQWEGFAVDRSIRYVRLILTNSSSRPALGYISAVQIWGAGQDITNPPGAVNPTFSGARLSPSSSYGSRNGSGSVRTWDQNPGTSWYTVDADPTGGYFLVWTPDVVRLTGVKWQFARSGNADEMRIETSVDGQTWSNVSTYGNGASSTWYGQQLYRQGRYVRFSFTNPNHDAVVGYISEIELWGASSVSSSSFEAQSVQSAADDCEPPVNGTPIPVSEAGTVATPVADSSSDADCETEEPDQTPALDATPVTESTPTALATPVPTTDLATPAPAATPLAEDVTLSDNDGEPSQTMANPSASPASLTGDGTGVQPLIDATPVATIDKSESTDTVTPPAPDASVAPTSEPTNAPLSTPNAEPTATPRATQPIAPEATTILTDETPTPAAFDPWIGYVVNTDGDPLNCRDLPGPDGGIVAEASYGTTLDVTGEPEAGWLPVRCEGSAAWVYAEFISTSPPEPAASPTEPAPEETSDDATSDPNDSSSVAEGVQVTPVPEPSSIPSPTMEPMPTPTPEPVPTPTTVPEPTSTPEPEPVLLVRHVEIPVASDMSASAVDGSIEEPFGDTVLAAGGPNQYVAGLTFDVSNVGNGTIINATLILTGAGSSSGPIGEVRVVPGYSVDPWSTTAADLLRLDGLSAGYIGSALPGEQSPIDLAGLITSEGTFTIMLPGDPATAATLLSQESGVPPMLVLTLEEWVVPSD